MARLKLTASVVDKAQPKEREYCIPDSEQKGFILRVRPSGEKTFCLLYRNAASQRKRYTIGSADKYTLVQARAVAAQQLGKVALGADVQEEKQEARKDLTLDQFLTEHYSPWLCEHLRTGEAIERKIRMAFKGLLNTKLSAISAFHVEKIRTEYTKAGKRTAANRYAEMIKALMARAHKWGFIEVNAIAGKVSRHREDPGRVRYLDAAEEARLLEALDRREAKQREERARMITWAKQRRYPTLPDLSGLAFTDYLKPLTLAVLYSGMRRGEAFSLLWTDINFDQNTITIRPESAKSQRMRHVPMCAALRQVFEQWRAQASGQGLVFPSPKTGKRLDNVTSSWEALMKDAKIEGFRFHDLRHSFASKLAMGGVDLNTIRELLGHADLKMTLRYAHLSPARTQAAVNVLDAPAKVIDFQSAKGSRA